MTDIQRMSDVNGHSVSGVATSNKRSFSASTGESAANYMTQLLSQPKRAKLDTVQDSNETSDEEDDEQEVQVKRAGYIKKLTLKNFMCHDHFELTFGPHMNFIIGRNGSGKSAILTGISVGLGAKATDTSRGTATRNLIKDGKNTAKILVEIENDGINAFEPETYGKSIFVERRLNRGSPGSYAIKSENGSTVSNKKKTLDDILQRFFIVVNNPLSFLSQDKAREFLANSTEQTRYTHFSEGTNIQSIIRNYEHASQDIHKLQYRLDIARSNFKEASQKFLDCERLYKKYKQSHTLRKQLEKLHGKIYWFNVLVQEKKISKKELDKSEKITEAENFEQTAQTIKANVEQREEEGKQLLAEKREVESQLKLKEDEYAIIESSYDEAASKVQQVVSDLKSYKAEMEECEKQIKQHQSDLLIEQKKIDDANGGTKQAITERLEALKTHKEKLVSSRDTLQANLAKLQNPNPELIALSKEQDEVSNSISSLQSRMMSAEKAKNDRFAAFGSNCARLVRDIDRESSWHQKPIGPVGCYVSVKDTFHKWSDFINATLQRTLDSFVVCDEHDRKILNGLMRNNSIHKSIIVRKFEKFGFSNQVSSRYSTMLNALEFQNEDAKFTLIDSTGLEEIVLCDSILEAEEVTRDRLVKQAFCLNDRKSGVKLARRDGLLSRDPVFYARDLKKLAGKVDSNSFVGELEDLKKQSASIQEKKISLQRAARERKVALEQDLEKMKSQLQKVNNLIFKTEKALVEEGDYGKIASLNLQIELCENQKKTKEGMSVELWQNLTERKKTLQEIKEQLQNAKRLKKTEARKLEECETKVNHHYESLQNLNAEYAQAMGKNRNVLAAISSLAESIERDKEILTDLINLALEQCARSEVSISDTDTAKTITTEYQNVQQAIQEMERQNEKPFDEVQKDLMSAKAAKDKCEESLVQIDSARVHLENDLNSRFENLNITIREKLSRAKNSFELSLSLRGFKGKLDFDFANRKVITEVQTKDNKDTRAVLSLSGGEKSFTQIAFLLSIWKVMKPRVCGLDEFDVYMDSVNRTIAIKLLMHELRNSTAQSIFITPQDIAAVGGLEDSADVRIHRILPPRKD